jgi:hypothetical protein
LHLQVDVNTEVGVIHDYALRELRLFTDYGRTSRPLFIVEEGNQLAFKRQHLEALISRCVTIGCSLLHCCYVLHMRGGGQPAGLQQAAPGSAHEQVRWAASALDSVAGFK